MQIRKTTMRTMARHSNLCSKPKGYFMRYAFWLYLLCVSASAEVQSSPGPRDVLNLFNKSGTVLLAQLSSTPEVLQGSTNATEFSVKVLRTYKGVPNSQVDLLAAPELLQALEGQAKDQKFFMFLDETTNVQPILGVDRRGIFRTRGMLSRESSSGLTQLEHDSVSSLDGSLGDIDDLEFLLLCPSVDTYSEALLDKDAQAGPLTIRALALAVLMTTGREKYFTAAYDLLTMHGVEVPSDITMAIAGKIRQEADQIPVDTLNSFSSIPMISIKLSSMEAIRKIKSSRSIPILVEHLDDSHPFIRYLAVSSLSEIVQGAGIAEPTVPDFEQDPSRYTNEWKAWWASKGKTTYGQASVPSS